MLSSIRFPVGTIEVNYYLKNNIGLDDQRKLYLCVTLSPNIGVMHHTFTVAQANEYMAAIEKANPKYKDKLFYHRDPSAGPNNPALTYIYLRLRSYTKNTSELKFKFMPKFGPYDVVYQKVGTFKKQYIDMGGYEGAQVPKDGDELVQADYIQESLTLSLQNQLADFVNEGENMRAGDGDQPILYKWGEFALVGSSYQLQDVLNSLKSLTVKSIPDYSEFLLYLRANHTLAKWFSGKKSALQKINQERINSYLDKDKQSLKNVMHFFGGDGKFVDKRR